MKSYFTSFLNSCPVRNLFSHQTAVWVQPYHEEAVPTDQDLDTILARPRLTTMRTSCVWSNVVSNRKKNEQHSPFGKHYSTALKRVIVTPAVYPRLVEFLHFDNNSNVLIQCACL